MARFGSRTGRSVVRFIVAAGLALAVVAMAPAAPSGERVTGVAGSVERISADGGRVAISSHFETVDRVCDRVAVWSPASGAVFRSRHPGQCRENDDSHDDAVVDLAFAGGRAVWTDYSYGNHAYCNAVLTATTRRAKPSVVSNAPCGLDHIDQFFELAGGGSLLAVASYLFCGEEECQDDRGGFLPEGNYDVVLWRLSGSKLVKLADLDDRSRLLAADSGRIVVLEPAGAVVLYDSGGKVLRTLPYARGEVSDARLSGSQLIVRKRGSLQVVDAAKGSLVRSLTLSSSAKLEDVDRDLAVYVKSRTLFVLRLSDGRSRAYAKVRGLVDADLEPSGLFYAYNERTGAKPGRVVFVPSADLAKLLA